MSAARTRALALVGALGFVAATRAACDDPVQRAELQYALVLPLGYGHLLGALVFSRRRLQARLPAEGRIGWALLVVSTLATGLALYTEALTAWPVTSFGTLFAVSTWHTVENDLALGRAHGAGTGLGPIPREARHHGTAVALTAALVAAAALVARTPNGALADVVAGSVLYHVVAWLVHSVGRARAAPGPGRAAGPAMLRRLWALHAAPAALCAAAAFVPGAVAAAGHDLITSPALYLFWSLAHVAQTLVSRGLEPA